MEVRCLLHEDLNNTILNDILEIKSIFGKYSYESQLAWLDENIKINDLHFLVYDSDCLIGYANLIKEQIKINGEEDIKIHGLGNVCVSKQGKGYGNILMKFVNQFYVDNSLFGLLFCKKPLVDFYKKHGWLEVDTKPYRLNVNSMIYNFNRPSEQVTYTGRNF